MEREAKGAWLQAWLDSVVSILHVTLGLPPHIRALFLLYLVSLFSLLHIAFLDATKGKNGHKKFNISPQEKEPSSS